MPYCYVEDLPALAEKLREQGIAVYGTAMEGSVNHADRYRCILPDYRSEDVLLRVANPIMAIENLTATTLRNIIGDLELNLTRH